jgi:hypothetical protein
MRRKTVGASAAAEVLGISPELTRYRARAGHIPVARRRPLRFRLAALLDYQEQMPPVRPYGGRPRAITRMVEEL